MRWLSVLGGDMQRAQLLTQRHSCSSQCRWSWHRVQGHTPSRAHLSHMHMHTRQTGMLTVMYSVSRPLVRNSALWSAIQRLGCLRTSRWGGVLKLSGLVGAVAVACMYRQVHLHGNLSTRALCHRAVAPDFEGSELQVSMDSLSPGSQMSLFQKFSLTLRLVYLSFLFFPVIFLRGLSPLLNSKYLSRLSWRYMLVAIQIAGPAFVKLGQWASTRRDLFSEEFCSILSCLHTHCDPHSWEDTVKILLENFGTKWRDELIIVETEPIGSGCVAQVYKGHLRLEKGRANTSSGVSSVGSSTKTGDSNHVNVEHTNPSTAVGNSGARSPTLNPHPLEAEGSVRFVPIAVKVLHPGIVDQMERDICVMKYVASWVDYVYPDVHWVALKECVHEFSQAMWKQLDLKEEANNLLQFRHLLRDYPNVKFPLPIQPYVTNSVLVESFEHGTQISNYLDKPGGRLQKNLARIGIEVLLNMLFIHNLVHGDLHPGNILVQQPQAKEENPTLVLLDCGIATSLSPQDLESFIAVFTAIVKGEGTKVADLMLGSQQCANREEYRRSMAELVETGRLQLNLKETQVGVLFSGLFNILIEHKVRIEPQYTCVMVAMMVIEGLGRSLDPSLDILAAAKPVLLEKAKQTFRQKVQSYATSLLL